MPRCFSLLGRSALAMACAGVACASEGDGPGRKDPPPVDASVLHDASGLGPFCDLPGSVVWSGGRPAIVAGGPKLPDMTWLTLPDGYCAHYYANVPENRLLRFAPNGDLFAASPSTPCAGGATGGMGAIVVLPDDDANGVADTTVIYKDNLGSTQGLLFNGGFFYYQDGPKVMRVPYTKGDRVAPAAAAQTMIDVEVYVSSVHWPKTFDADGNGNIYVGNGGDQGDACDPSISESARPFHGGVLRIDGTPGGELIAKGLRNPIAIRCAKGTGTCFGLELARDFDPDRSREKLFPIRKGDDWGFPCCATANLPYSDISPVPSCTGVQPETTTFIIDHTPFDLDFEPGAWLAPWKSRVFVALHGWVGSWKGSRIVAIAVDPTTGLPVASSEADGGTSFTDFATGWDNGSALSPAGTGQNLHGRATTLAFAPDGRLFVGNDTNGDIFWVAPVTADAPDASGDH